jgi:hypothetical protein
MATNLAAVGEAPEGAAMLQEAALAGASRPDIDYPAPAVRALYYHLKDRSGSRRSRFVAVPVKGRSAETDRLLPRYKGIYHVGCTDYPNPTYP